MSENVDAEQLDLSTVKLQDVIDVEFLQGFQDDFATAIGVASVSVDVEGKPVTRGSQFTRFCMDYSRNSEIGNDRCIECDRQGGEEAARTGKPSVYECHAGLIDFAVPILLEGRQIGSIIGGQVLDSEPNLEKYEKIASEIGIDSEAYVEAVREVKVLTRERIEAAANVLWTVANNMTKTWYEQHRLSSMANVLNENMAQMAATIEEVAVSSSEVSENQAKLNAEIHKVNDLTKQINEVIDFIKAVSEQTKLLGLNAAIEAARAGEAGLSFGVVAKEIRKLSSDSAQTVNKIKEFTNQIMESVDNTVQMGKTTTSAAEQQAAAMEEISSSLDEIAHLTENLKELASVNS